jgi:hypothetical protein
MKPITVTVTPSRDGEGRRTYSSRGQLFDATMLAGAARTSTHHRGANTAEVLIGRDGRSLVTGSATPLLDAARVPLEEGVDPKTPIAMRHAGGSHDALVSTIGAAAALTVREGEARPAFTRWEPNNRFGTSGSVKTDAPAATPAAE